ncbi:hypothetical protein KUTeg_023137 [Tegillarca granosa]|uniref:G-protein coupled receptors family 1 profile domain-containing protein n=1 Tax=Tegillarca granosa TaxID=220873 RepID=A0ABQ9E1D0_TEGGR|nr:hypothetical protein KUTeg_023137 [Tegillarca granosa]
MAFHRNISYQKNSTNFEDFCGLNFSLAELPCLLLMTLIFNAVSIFVLVNIRGQIQTNDHFLVLTLAINDFVTTLLYAIMLVGGWITCGSIMEDNSCSIFGWLSTGMVVWSAWIIIIMTVVRYLATVRPVYYRTNVTVSKLAIALVVTLVLTLAQLIFPFFHLAVPYAFYEDNRICAYEFAPGRGGVIHRSILGILASEGLIATLIVLYCNISIICQLRRKNVVHATTSRVMTSKQTFKSKRTAFANVTKVRVLYDVVENSPDQNELRHSVTMILLFMSPLLNPLVYVACNKKYREYIVNGMKLCWSKISPKKKQNSINMDSTTNTDIYTTPSTQNLYELFQNVISYFPVNRDFHDKHLYKKSCDTFATKMEHHWKESLPYKKKNKIKRISCQIAIFKQHFVRGFYLLHLLLRANICIYLFIYFYLLF